MTATPTPLDSSAVTGVPVVALCGSRDGDRVRQAEADLALAGKIVLAPFLLAHLSRAPLGDAERALLGAVHRAKIALADEVVVVNPDKQLTEATFEEIAYALRAGRPVGFTEPVATMGLREDYFDAMLGSKTIEVRRLDPKRLALRPSEVIRFECAGRALLARVMTLRHSPNARALVSGLDPSMVVPGVDREELAKRLEEIYPGLFDTDTPMIAIEVSVLGELPSVISARPLPPGCSITWHPGPVPAGILVTGAAGWLVDPLDGRVLVQCRDEGEGTRRFTLPGGRAEPIDGGDLLATLVREAVEESQVEIDAAVAVYLGCQIVTGYPGRPDPQAKARFLVPISLYDPIATDVDDPALRTHRRLMTSVGRAEELLAGGAAGQKEAAAALVAARALGIPVDAPADEGFRDGDGVPGPGVGERR